jgi:hypothetical protein
MSYRFCWLLATGISMDPDPASKQSAKPVWHIPIAVYTVLDSWWRSENLSETCRVIYQNKFQKLVHLVGFIIRIYHDARSSECQINVAVLPTGLWVERRRLWFPAGDEKFFQSTQIFLWCLPNYPFNGWSGLCVGSKRTPLMLTTLLHIVLVLRMSGALPLLLFMPSWRAQWYFLYLCRSIVPS